YKSFDTSSSYQNEKCLVMKMGTLPLANNHIFYIYGKIHIYLFIIKLRSYCMEVTFLGTGAGMPSKERNVSALILNLLHEINELWLFDCGEATQHQILRTT